MARMTLKAEMAAMRKGSTRVYPLARRATVYSTASILKRWTGQCYHVDTDWENRLLVVKREA